MKSIVDKAREAKNYAIKLRDGSPESDPPIPPNYQAAADVLMEMLTIIQAELDAFKRESPGRMVEDAAEGEIAVQGVHLNGSLGGVYRRWGRLDDAVRAYAAGARIERDARYKLKETYTSTQHAVVSCLVQPKLIVDAAIADDSAFRRELMELRTRVCRLAHGDVYKTADLAIISLLLLHPEWRKSLNDFVTIARNRKEDYARCVTFQVISEIVERVRCLPLEDRAQLSQWDEAENWPG